MVRTVVIRQQNLYTDSDPSIGTVDHLDQCRPHGQDTNWVQIFFTLITITVKGPSMRKASSRGFGFTAIAVLVILMACSALFTRAEAAIICLF
ncbi:hypothetical protein [Rheinheimera sp. F8]|uniref:hypothetical protein n=1 Tax=Rheinheimera sp. F8 TaxID=1763998 RepID=UPI001AD82592|nr:hypothetical protein [Rheinheimera sp. F8]